MRNFLKRTEIESVYPLSKTTIAMAININGKKGCAMLAGSGMTGRSIPSAIPIKNNPILLLSNKITNFLKEYG